jgi:hypothetical protein
MENTISFQLFMIVLRPGFEPGICDSKGHNA